MYKEYFQHFRQILTLYAPHPKHTYTLKLLLQMGLLHNLVGFPVLYPAEIQFHKTCNIDCILCRYICSRTFCIYTVQYYIPFCNHDNYLKPPFPVSNDLFACTYPPGKITLLLNFHVPERGTNSSQNNKMKSTQ